MKIVTAAEMREIDRITTEKYGLPSLTLMENAGSAVAQFVLEEYPDAKQITVVCGKGNNGGDGLVAARKLHEGGKQVSVLLLANPAELKGDAAEMLKRLPNPPVVVREPGELGRNLDRIGRSDLMIDAILGTGFRPPISELYRTAIDYLRSAGAPVVAVDIPSGVESDATNVQEPPWAEAVVTFTAPKPAHVFASIAKGAMVVAPIGSPEEAIQSSMGVEVVTPRELKVLRGRRPANANKGDFGHVLIFGGSLGKSGAAAMAGMASLKVGAGLATVATPRSALPNVAAFTPELMTEPLEETEAGTASGAALTNLLPLVKRKTVVAIGPGLSQHSATVWAVREFVRACTLPIVLDADGLNAVVVLKGHRTVITEPGGKVWVNMTGNPGMAKGGTGDVLTGMIAGMIAQHPTSLIDAVLAAVYLHGLAGDLAVQKTGERSLMAIDLVSFLPDAFRWVSRNAGEAVTTLRLASSHS